MPNRCGLVTRRKPERARHVVLAIDAGKDENGGFHSARASSPPATPTGEGGEGIKMKANRTSPSPGFASLATSPAKGEEKI
jgi:hypothetical protein